MAPSAKLLAGVELGGTKCVCILGTGPDDVRAVERLPTAEREETLRQIDSVLDRWRSQYGAPRALGIASFGPVDLRAKSPTYGFITSTTKAGWRNTDVALRLGRRIGAPLGFDTDVNGAALAEGRWGAAKGLDDFAYVTVGTGIGVGTIVRGRSVFGMNHTELGHIRVARKPGDKFPGVCPLITPPPRKMRDGAVVSTMVCMSCPRPWATKSQAGWSGGSCEAGMPARASMAGPEASPSMQSP